MTHLRQVVLALALALSVAACGTDDTPDALALSDEATSLDSDTALDDTALDDTAQSDNAEVDASTSTAAPTTTTAAPTTTTAAPTTTTAAPTTTTAAPTTTTAAPTTTTTVASSASCSQARYSIVIPTNWFEDDCSRFSEGPFPAPDAPIEFRPEIDVKFTTTETYAQALARIQSTHTVLSSQATTVDGLAAESFIVEEEWFEIGERTIVVVDAGDGVLIASANELVDIQAPTQMPLDVRYFLTLQTFNAMLTTMTVVPG